MSRNLRLALTADLHWGHAKGVEVNRKLVEHLHAHPADGLIIAGDVGTGDYWAECLRQFTDLPGFKAVLPGNHDIWIPHDETRIDSLVMYQDILPEVSRDLGFHYLDDGPLLLEDADLGIVGSINWYDYSWSLDELRQRFPNELERLRTKRFSRGRHNDANFVRWELDDPGFTRLVVGQMAAHLEEALASVPRVLAFTHHPAFHSIAFPRPPGLVTLDMDQLLWDAFCGNTSMEQLLLKYADRIPMAFSGHTHRAAEGMLGSIRGINIGSDYPFKRLLYLDWPALTIEVVQFDP
jgi:predicted phosphohydrolase